MTAIEKLRLARESAEYRKREEQSRMKMILENLEKTPQLVMKKTNTDRVRINECHNYHKSRLAH